MSEKQVKECETPQDRPPQPPELKPEFRLERHQWFTIPLMLLIPIIGLFGVFDNASREAQASENGLQARVVYPSRVRYKNRDVLRVALRNTSGQPIPDITIGIDRPYVETFTEVNFTPSAEDVTGREYRVKVGGLAPGEERSIRVDVEPEEYWGHEGLVRVTAPGYSPLEVPIRTFVLP